MKKLYITEIYDVNHTGWYLSFEKPEFQGGITIKIDKKTAEYLLIDLKKVLDFVERYNKQDKEVAIAESASRLENLI